MTRHEVYRRSPNLAVTMRGQEDSGALREILENGAAPQAFLKHHGALDRACGACHDRYRKPDG